MGDDDLYVLWDVVLLAYRMGLRILLEPEAVQRQAVSRRTFTTRCARGICRLGFPRMSQAFCR